MRELLILLQFIISVSVIACALLMTLQMRYVSHKPLGFNKENRLIIPLHGAEAIRNLSIIKKELLKNSNILGTSDSNARMLDLQLNPGGGFIIENNDGVLEKDIPHHSIRAGDDFLEVMGMQLTAGRDFSKKVPTDAGSSFIVNETLVKKMGWKEPLGKRLQMEDRHNGRVIGVVKDFHYESLHNQVEPIILYQDANFYQNLPDEVLEFVPLYFFLHISGKDTLQTIKFLQGKFAEFDSNRPFQYEFLDDSLDKLYMSEQRAMKLIGVFAGVCILISCLGLFGLAAFTTEQRTKEIGVRKVLGATTWQIITMLSLRILLLVLGGAVIASLIAYYAMDEWLTSFAYRTGINPWVFLVSALMAAGVAFITVALQSFKTARANPVEALRYE